MLFVWCVLNGTLWHCEGVTVYTQAIQLEISQASFKRVLIGSCVCYVWICTLSKSKLCVCVCVCVCTVHCATDKLAFESAKLVPVAVSDT